MIVPYKTIKDEIVKIGEQKAFKLLQAHLRKLEETSSQLKNRDKLYYVLRNHF